MQNYDKVVARRFLARVAGRKHRRSVGNNVFFFVKRQSLKARIHKPKSICVELNVR